METSKTLIGQQSSDLTLFAVDTHVSLSQQLEKEEEKMIQDTYGLGLEMPLAHYDRLTQSWKMFEDISLWGEYKSLENLPKSGMTRNGELFQQPVWVRPIDAIALSSWPTPTTQEVEHPEAELTAKGRRKSKNGKTSHSLGLADAVAKYPTPIANGMAGGSGAFNKAQSLEDLGQITKEERIAIQAGNGGKLNPMWVEWLMGFPLGWTDLED